MPLEGRKLAEFEVLDLLPEPVVVAHWLAVLPERDSSRVEKEDWGQALLAGSVKPGEHRATGETLPPAPLSSPQGAGQP